MSRLSRLPILGGLAFALLVACSGGSSHTPASDAAIDGAGGQGAPGTGGTGGTTAGMTCQAIRVCAGLVATEAEVQTCVAKGTPAAQQMFRDLEACRVLTGSMAANCTSDLDLNCVCREECQADGYCLAAAETCLGGATTDLFCDGPCLP